MIKAEQIPDGPAAAYVEALKRAKSWKECFAAALNAWPGIDTGVMIFVAADERYLPHIILPSHRRTAMSDEIEHDKPDTITTLRAEIERLRAELHTASDMNAVYEACLQEKEAEVKGLRAALEAIANLPGELNPSNYDHDDVCACNAALCETWGIARVALEKK